MEKTLFSIAACLLSLSASAQKCDLVGMWQQLDDQGNPTTQVKAFMPDGKLLGLSYNSDFTNSSVWFMSNYDVLSELAYVDHSIYHSSIEYERDFFFTYSFENDSVMVTKYPDYKANGRLTIMTERWKKMDKELPKYTDEEWQALLQKSLVEFDRLPKAGQSVEQYANELNKKAEGYMKANRPDHAAIALLTRAALDTNNLQWQRDALEFFVNNKMAPSVAERVADRAIRLAEAKATLPSDTAVLNVYRQKAYLLNYRGNKGMPQLRSIISKVIDRETKAGHLPSEEYGLDYFMMVMSYLPDGNFDAMYDNIVKAIDILEKSKNVARKQIGEGYFFKAMCLMNTDREREAINVFRDQTIPLMVEKDGQQVDKVQLHIYPGIFQCYLNLLKKNPKDKELLKEYQQFLADKVVMADYKIADKVNNLFGEYIVVELGPWTIEKPTANFSDEHLILMKDGKFFEPAKSGTEYEVHITTVDAAKKKDIIKQWKANKKGKKVKK